jgi:hypothetical protein
VGIGDEILAAGDARRERARLNSGPVGIVDRWGRRRWHPLWEYCPDVARPEVSGPVVTNAGKARPYIDWPASTSQRWAFIPYRPTPARIDIPADIVAWAARCAGRVVVEPNIKPGASPNKDWGWGNWERLVGHHHGLPWLQLGEAGARRLAGVEFLACPSFIHAAAVLSVARFAVLPEGGLHHAAAAVGCRAVVIFGGYVSPANTGYDIHANLFTGGEPCGNRRACDHCRKAMTEITVYMVASAMERFCK